MCIQGAGEVSRGHSSGSRLVVPREGPNLQMQGAVWGDSMGLIGRQSRCPGRGGDSTVRRRGGTYLPHSRRLWQLTASPQQRALAQELCASIILKTPPYTASTYGCVGGRGREAPPTRSGGS